MKHRILYAEDEPVLGQQVTEALQQHGFDTIRVSNGSDITPAFKKHQPHLCLLDIMLPGIDGYEAAGMLRTLDRKIPLIFLTARIQPADLVKGFKAGCNDYIPKPFHIEEVLVRVDNWLQMQYGDKDAMQPGVRQIGTLIFDTDRQILHTASRQISLSYREAELLDILCKHRNTIVSRNYVLQKIWGGHTIYNSRILDVYLSRLRKYFAQEHNVEIITLRGIGFKFLY